VVQLRGTPQRFAGGAFAAALQVLLLLNLVDVDGMIVRVNVARAAEGRAFDRSYVTQLGAGAVPAVLRAADRMPWAERCNLMREMESRWSYAARDSRPSWNVERARATGPLLERLARRVRTECGVRAPVPPPTPRG
jgi:hypothetical protein